MSLDRVYLDVEDSELLSEADVQALFPGAVDNHYLIKGYYLAPDDVLWRITDGGSAFRWNPQTKVWGLAGFDGVTGQHVHVRPPPQ